jgi:threonine dehydratase
MRRPAPETRSLDRTAAQPTDAATDAGAASGYIERILGAHVYDVARETPLDPAPRLSRRLGQRVLLKREDLQPVFSFKLRGAYNKLARLRREDPTLRGVVAASAGNHAQGVALGAARMGLAATIVMPRTTPEIKVDAVRALGAEVALHGDTYDEALGEARRRERREGLTFVHAYDDPDVIAGQGTVAMELLRQHPGPLDAIFIPVGGGGLAAGIAVYARFLRPEVKLIGVEPVEAACLDAALRAGRPVELDQVGLFADGAAVGRVGDEPFRLLRDRIDEVVTVGTDEICAAILDVFEDTRVMAEPAGALAVAGLKRYVERAPPSGQTLAAILSGANISFHRLRHISERAELGERREAILAVTIPERRGSFRAFCEAVGDCGITEFNYRYADPERARIFVGIQLREGEDERRRVVGRLGEARYPVVDLTDNELAKVHLRHMVGGRAPRLGRERLYHFEFPERPGALRRFLDCLGARWNITLFHYRNHGAAQGRVLAGFEVPDEERPAFRAFLETLAYPFSEETDNPAYELFLG